MSDTATGKRRRPVVSWTISPEARDIVRGLARRLKSTESDAADLALLIYGLFLHSVADRPELEEAPPEAEEVAP